MTMTMPADSRLVKITTGHCNTIHPSRGLCHCTAGSSITRDTTVAHTCDVCFHPFSSHQDYAEPYDSVLEKPNIINRLTTVSKLADLLDAVRVVQVTAPPSSGKTTLAHQLHRHYSSYGEPVVFLTGWAENKNPRYYLMDQCRAAGYDPLAGRGWMMDKMVIIIDEAEASYRDTMLWGSDSRGFGLLRAYASQDSGPKICLFTGYGTGHGITTEQRGSLRKGPLDKLPEYDWGLCYSEEEFGAVLRCLCAGFEGIELSDDAGGYLYSVTGGYPGAVTSLVNYVYETYTESKGAQITKQHLVNALDNGQVFEKLKPPVNLSFPSPDTLTPAATDFLWQVLDNKTIPLDLKHPGAKLCYEMGWVHTEPTDGREGKEQDLVCFLPSRLHEKYIEYLLQSLHPKPFPSTTFPTLTTLCEAILRIFSPKILLSSKTALIPAIPSRPPATLFRDEWFRAFHAVVGHGVGIASAWEYGGRDRVDFTIKEPTWGVQVLCEAEDGEIEECCNRLSEPGGGMRDWIVLDCRRSVPAQGCDVPGDKLWRVVFTETEDYSSAVVLNCDNEVVVPEFLLDEH